MRPMKTFTRNRRRKFIETYEYAPDFIAKLQDELGDRATALRALEACAPGTSPASTPTTA